MCNDLVVVVVAINYMHYWQRSFARDFDTVGLPRKAVDASSTTVARFSAPFVVAISRSIVTSVCRGIAAPDSQLPLLWPIRRSIVNPVCRGIATRIAAVPFHLFVVHGLAANTRMARPNRRSFKQPACLSTRLVGRFGKQLKGNIRLNRPR
jgi:hypothetical protein